MFLLDWISSPFVWAYHYFFPSDEDKVKAARDTLENSIVNSPQALAWMRQSGWSVGGGDVSAALHNPVTRDAAIFAAIKTFPDTNDDPQKMLTLLTRNGLNNGSTTRSYVFNTGAGTLGQSDSNHQALMLVDESQSPPLVTLAFRGMNPGADWWSPISGIIQALFGYKASDCDAQAEKFWQGAKGDITRILNEVQTRHPGEKPSMVLAGYSYGADAAARMVPKFAESFPQLKNQLQLVGYGAPQTITRGERDGILAVLGGESSGRAKQYFARNDFVQRIGLGYCVGQRREAKCDTGHLGYDQSSQLEAIMDAYQQQLAADPKHAQAKAEALADAYRRDPTSVLRELAAYTNAPPPGNARTQVGISAIIPRAS